MKLAPRTNVLSLRAAIADTLRLMQHKSILRHRGSWQAQDMSHNPAAATYELIGHNIVASLGTRDLAYYVSNIQPDLPWADDHFQERVSGLPLNPPPSEAWWPHAPKGNADHKHGEIFSHTYPERMWPKYAGRSEDFSSIPTQGIRYSYGDLNDVVILLAEDPQTRQAYLPIWFPEDTGGAKVRKPCTLGYHFLLTDNSLDIFYFIRSCDVHRHMRNDIYLTVRLLLWVLERLEAHDSKWSKVEPGILRMYISNLHLFRNDYRTLYGVDR